MDEQLWAHVVMGRGSRKTYYKHAILATLLAGLIFLLDFMTPRGVAISVLYILPILLTMWVSASHAGHIVALAALCFILTVAGYFLSSESTVPWIAITNRLLALAAITTTAVLSLLCMQATEDLHALRQLLPICASCKKIRDDEGYWNHVDSYFTDHFNATFTHGICPDCARMLYPDVVRKHLRYSDARSQREPGQATRPVH